MPILLVILETFFLFKLYNKFKFNNCIVLVYFIVYFYCNAILFDLYVFSNEAILTQTFIKIDPNSEAFDLVFISNFLYLFSFFLFFYFSGPQKLQLYNNEKKTSSLFNIHDTVLILFSFILLYFAFQNMLIDRYTAKDNATFFTQLLDVLFSFFFVYIIFYTRNRSAVIRFSFIAAFITYSFFRYEREPLVLLLIIVLLYFNTRIKIIYLAFGGLFFLFLFSYYKAIYGTIEHDMGWSYFVDLVKSRPISLSSLDPIASFSLLYDYFESAPSFYTQYKLSYFTSFSDQYMRYIEDKEVQSIGQFVSDRYVSGEYGVAFSMILESLLNFHLLGPIILALATKITYDFLCSNFYYIKYVIDSMFVVFFASFIRTELMVMIKIYLIPMSVFILVLFIVNKKRKTES